MALQLIGKLQKLATVSAKARNKATRKKSAKTLPKWSNTRDVFAAVSPEFDYPEHFDGYIQALESSIDAELRLVFSAPPQHGKSEATLHVLLLLIAKYPGRSHAYMTYSVERAQEISRRFATLLSRAGIPYSGTLNKLHFPGGTTLRLTSADKGLNGAPVNGLFVVDDFYKDQAQADSPVQRKAREIAWRGSVIPRMHPGASCVILATRWHPLDMSGMLIKEGYRLTNLPAYAEENDPLGREINEVLWSRRDAAFLEKQRVAMGDEAFAAMYQGHPRMRGSGFLRTPAYYQVLPTSGYRVAFGFDLAYTEDTKADESVCVEVWRTDRVTAFGETVAEYWLVSMVHGRWEVPKFAEKVKEMLKGRPDPVMLWRCSGTEKGSAQLLRREPYALPLRIKTSSNDKRIANTPMSIDWNNGRIMLPDPKVFPDLAKWIAHLVEQASDFTGTGKEHDDLVDAIGNAHYSLSIDWGDGTIKKASGR